MTPEMTPQMRDARDVDDTHFRIYNEQATMEAAMKGIWDPEKDEELSRVDLDLTAAGYTATPGGRAAGFGIVLLCGLATVAFIWWLV